MRKRSGSTCIVSINVINLRTRTHRSEATADMIDNEAREIITEQYSKSMEILQAKRDILEKAARLLLEKEKLKVRS